MDMPDVVLGCRLLINARTTMGKLTYVNMKKQSRAIHACGSNDSVSEEDAKVKIEASYINDKEDTREMCFIVIAVRRGATVEIIEALIREVVVKIQEEKERTEEIQDGRTL